MTQVSRSWRLKTSRAEYRQWVIASYTERERWVVFVSEQRMHPGNGCLIGLVAVAGLALAGEPPEDLGTTREAQPSFLRWEVFLSQRFQWKQHFLNLGAFSDVQGAGNPSDLYFDQDETSVSFVMGAGASWRITPRLTLHSLIDSGELKFPKPLSSLSVPLEGPTSNGRPIEKEARTTGFVRELFSEIRWGEAQWLNLRVGKLLLSEGNNFLLNNYVLGFSFQADLDINDKAPIKLGLDAFLPNGDFTAEDKQSPMLVAELSYVLSMLEDISMFAAWFHDGSNSLAPLLKNLYPNSRENRFRTSGDLYWLGARSFLLLGDASLSVIGMLEWGGFETAYNLSSTTTEVLTEIKRPNVLAGMFHIQLDLELAEQFSLGTFFLYLSGETGQRQNTNIPEPSSNSDKRFSSFIGIYPYITRMNIFFSGGLNQNFSGRSLSTSGINARGVLAPGLVLGWYLGETLSVRAVGAALWADGKNQENGNRFYGIEGDLMVRWRIGRNWQLLFEADVFWTGPFFDFAKPITWVLDWGQRELLKQTGPYHEEPTAYKLGFGVDFSF